jgi:hypothetical protein
VTESYHPDAELWSEQILYALSTKKICEILGTLCIKRDAIGKGITAIYCHNIENYKEGNIMN